MSELRSALRSFRRLSECSLLFTQSRFRKGMCDPVDVGKALDPISTSCVQRESLLSKSRD